MRPEEVPVQFATETIQFAITTWMMGATEFEGEDVQALGQMFAILVGRRINQEREHGTISPGELIERFVQDCEDQVPEDLRSQFAVLEPDCFDRMYQAILTKAREQNVDLAELADALFRISVVTRYFSMQLQKSKA